MSEPLVIVFPIYQGVTQLDFTGPLQFLRHMPGAEIIVASVDGADVESEGLHFTQLRPLPEIARCDVLCVPGGSGCTQALQDEAFMQQIRRLGADARYLTSVCTGSLILAAAGLLQGKRAACHWSMRDSLKLFGAVHGRHAGTGPAAHLRQGTGTNGGKPGTAQSVGGPDRPRLAIGRILALMRQSHKE